MARDLKGAVRDYIDDLETIIVNKQYLILDWDRKSLEEEIETLKRLV